MKTLENKTNGTRLKKIELSRLADDFLEENGYSITGRPLREDRSLYNQRRFEGRFLNGAYSKAGESQRFKGEKRKKYCWREK